MTRNVFRLSIVILLVMYVGILGYQVICPAEAIVPGDGVLQVRYGTERPKFLSDGDSTLITGSYQLLLQDNYISCVIYNDYTAASIDVSFDSSTKAYEVKAQESLLLVDVFNTSVYLKKNNNPCTGYRISGTSKI